MVRSLANGDYSFVMLVESAKAEVNTWYRVLRHKITGLLSCDCPIWVFGRDTEMNAQGATIRLCKHCRGARELLARQRPHMAPVLSDRAPAPVPTTHPLVAATQQQWRGLGGVWRVEQRSVMLGDEAYELVLLSLQSGNGFLATGLVAFSARHHRRDDYESMIPGIALWGGFSIASQIAQTQEGFETIAPPNVYFKVRERTTRGTQAPETPVPAMPRRQTASPIRLGLADILRVGDNDTRDGFEPEERAESTLRLFLGEPLYATLERQEFLDVSSVAFAAQQRVYRLRRDPYKASERRVRVFEHGRYINDYCIVRGQSVPEADHYLTVFLSLLSDERQLLSVVGQYNIFPTDSERIGGERVPAHWTPPRNVA